MLQCANFIIRVGNSAGHSGSCFQDCTAGMLSPGFMASYLVTEISTTLICKNSKEFYLNQNNRKYKRTLQRSESLVGEHAEGSSYCLGCFKWGLREGGYYSDMVLWFDCEIGSYNNFSTLHVSLHNVSDFNHICWIIHRYKKTIKNFPLTFTWGHRFFLLWIPKSV